MVSCSCQSQLRKHSSPDDDEKEAEIETSQVKEVLLGVLFGLHGVFCAVDLVKKIGRANVDRNEVGERRSDEEGSKSDSPKMVEGNERLKRDSH